MRLLSSQVFSIPCSLISEQGDHGDGQKAQVKPPMHAPGHAIEYTAAGTRHPIPETKDYQADVSGERGHQETRQQQSRELTHPEQQKPGSQQFNCGQNISERQRQFGGYGLVKKLLPEQFEAEQLADSGINEQQDQQGR